MKRQIAGIIGTIMVYCIPVALFVLEEGYWRNAVNMYDRPRATHSIYQSKIFQRSGSRIPPNLYNTTDNAE